MRLFSRTKVAQLKHRQTNNKVTVDQPTVDRPLKSHSIQKQPFKSNLTITNAKQLTHRAVGSHYEVMAKHYLIKQGLTFIEQNFQTKMGEVDLIFRDNSTFVFIEVKYRKNSQFGHAAEMVTPRKMHKLIKTAHIWLSKQHLSAESIDYRFDVIAIHDHGQDINWIQNAISKG